ncbi:phosphoesterase PA-phosphatase [Longispora sp. K20-0274]|uniref:phosphoesterase PA-phosphatase n=1 Tax=Longispora sp. K20-0274 TaxID=3088255 RepID=UPI00399B039C
MSTDSMARPTTTARVITEVCAPWVWCVSVPFAVAHHSVPGFWPGVGWAALIAFGAAVVPMTIIGYGVRTGTVRSGHHVTARAERLVPMLGVLLSAVALCAILAVAAAPPSMTAVAVVMLVSGATCLAITLRWKVSVHAAVAAGSAALLTLLYGVTAGPLWLVTVAVCWSRVRLGAHTPHQVLVGALIGTAAAGIYPLVMGL